MITVAAAFTAMPVPARAQSADEAFLKAAFLYHFIKFTDWPGTDTDGHGAVVACTTSPDAAAALAQIVQSKSAAGGRAIAVQRITGNSAAGCGLLYVPAGDERRAPALIASVKGEPVLTVGDSCAFVEAGGMMHFFIDEGQLRFAVAADAADAAGLHLSSQLLALAKLVKGIPNGHSPR